MKPKTQIQLAQEFEDIIQKMSEMDVEEIDIEKLIAAVSANGHGPATPWLKDQIRRAVTEAIRRRNLPKSHIPPGSGKASL